MPAIRKCRGCGADVPNNAPFGHCPKCLLELGFGPLPEAPEAPSPPSTAGGRRFGDYELLDQIGRGGMGIIYKARQVTLNRLVALKMIRAAEFASPTLVQRFHLEAEAAANLHHPNIVPIYETGEQEGEHFFSMELVDGSGLDHHITAAGFCLDRKAHEDKASVRTRQEQIARLMAKVARAVDYAHQHGVLHRDLKPSNVLLDRQCEPHLTDFGVAKVMGQAGINLTASGSIMGTPSYMAPEQAAGQSKRVTTAADIYSLGAILYEMLTGQPPFRADTPVETLKQVIEQEPKHPTTFKEGVDHDLATICMKCLEKEPLRRYGSAAALAEDLERWLRKEPIQAQPVSAVGRVWRWCRREPAIAGLAGGIAACLVAITVVALQAYRHAEKARLKEQEQIQELANAQVRLRSVTDQLIQEQLNDLDNFWTNSNDTSVTIPSDRLAKLTGRLPGKEGVPITFGAYTHTTPSDMFTRFAPILSYLETNAMMQVTVRVDFIIYRGYSNAVEALVNGQLGFMRPGPASYIKARQRCPSLRVLLKQLHDGKPIIHGVIFTRSDSDIVNVRDFAGKSVASADEESTFGNFVPKAFFYDQGIRMRNLSNWTFVGAHDETVKRVLAGAYHIGTANSNVVAKFIRQDEPLKIIHPMQSVSFPWIVSSNVEERVVQAIKQNLSSLKDPAILRKVDGNLDGFVNATPEDYDEFADNIMKKATAFDE